MPLAELAANCIERPDWRESDAAVERDTAFVRQGDACIGVAKSFSGQLIEQSQIERTSNTLAAVTRMHVRRNLDGPLVGRTITVGRTVGIRDAVAFVFGDEPLPPRQGRGDTSRELRDRRNRQFEGDSRAFDEGPVNRQQRRRISFGSGTNDSVGKGGGFLCGYWFQGGMGCRRVPRRKLSSALCRGEIEERTVRIQHRGAGRNLAHRFIGPVSLAGAEHLRLRECCHIEHAAICMRGSALSAPFEMTST